MTGVQTCALPISTPNGCTICKKGGKGHAAFYGGYQAVRLGHAGAGAQAGKNTFLALSLLNAAMSIACGVIPTGVTRHNWVKVMPHMGQTGYHQKFYK